MIISDHLGHCDINVTADIYADVLEGMKRNIAVSIQNALPALPYWKLQQNKKTAMRIAYLQLHSG